MQKRRVTVTLPTPGYRALERRARQDVRTAEQQASYLLRQILAMPERQPAERIAALLTAGNALAAAAERVVLGKGTTQRYEYLTEALSAWRALAGGEG